MDRKQYWFIRVNPKHLRSSRIGHFSLVPINMTVYTVFIIILLAFLACVFGVIGIWPQLSKFLGIFAAICGICLFIYALIFKTDYSLPEDPSNYPVVMKWVLKKEFRYPVH